jgi:hypothetical protein
METCTTAFFCDAFISNKSLDFIRDVKTSKDKGCVLHNTKPTEKQKFIQIPCEHMTKGIMDQLKAGKKVFVCGTKKSYIDSLETDCKAQGVEGLFYTKDSSAEMNDTLKNVNKVWNKVKIVAYSHKITVGVSYDLDDFDYCYIDASNNNSCSVRDIMQMSVRVRSIKSNVVYFCLPERIFASDSSKLMWKQFSEFEDFELMRINILKQHIKDDKKISWQEQEALYKALDDSSKEAVLKKLLFHNTLEQSVSVVHFKSLFTTMVKKQGHSIDLILNVKEKKKVSNNIMSQIKVGESTAEDEKVWIQMYVDVNEVSEDEVIELKRDVMYNVCAMKKFMIDKHYFENIWKSENIYNTA